MDVKERIRKIMAVAGDGVASEAEIETAMRLAAKLMDAHHLTEADIGTEADADDLSFGERTAVSNSTRLSTWEATLGGAIINLIGCVGWVRRGTGRRIVNGMMTGEGCKLGFYGPAKEAEEAAELFAGWSQSIATMAVARWGGCMKGEGAQYAYGFAQSLAIIAREINGERKLTNARPIAQLQGGTSTAITLSGRMQLIRDEAKKWFEKENGWKLRRGGGRSSMYSGSREAFHEGRSHGAKSGFGRAVRTKRLGN